MITPRALIFDLDNTLCQCTEFYNNAKQEMVSLINARIPGLNTEAILTRFHDYDLRAMRLGGFGATHFPSSLRAVFEILAAEHGYRPTDDELTEAYAIGQRVLTRTYPLYEGVYAMLQAYHASGLRLAIYTKGGDTVQRAKIKAQGIEKFFDVIHTTPDHKTADGWLAVVRALKVTPQDVLVIGDSLKDDIETASAAGLTTVHVTPLTTNPAMAQIGHSPVTPAYALSSVRDLISICPPPSRTR